MCARTPLLLVAGAALAPAAFATGCVLSDGIGSTKRNLARRSCER